MAFYLTMNWRPARALLNDFSQDELILVLFSSETCGRAGTRTLLIPGPVLGASGR